MEILSITCSCYYL